MFWNAQFDRAASRAGWALMLAAAILAAGCQSASYYAQAAKGEWQILRRAAPVDQLIADPQTAPALRTQLQLVRDLVWFAREDLKLPVDSHYCNYADLQRPYVVWTVQAAPQFSLQPKTWRYPLVGRLEYRGFFSESRAKECAGMLAAKGYDVCVEGVEAYSTLGWFKDPVLNTFIGHEEPQLAEIIFHELGHQRVFARSDTDFNEAFATALGEEGVRRWLSAQGKTGLLDRYSLSLRRNGQFVRLVMETRSRLEGVYGDSRDGRGKVRAGRNAPAATAELLREKQRAFDDLRRRYAALKSEWAGDSGYDDWFGQQLNNAKLNTVANYYDFVPGFERLLDLSGGDLERFYHAAEQLARMPEKARHQRLNELAKEGLAGTVSNQRPAGI